MTHKKWNVILITATVVTLVIFAGTMRILDPFLRYGKESPPLTCYEYFEMYANPGIATHYSYDAVMVGTSMVECTDADLCDELFDCHMVRLPYSGGTTYNMKTILDVCFESENDIKTVYWELDEFQLGGNPDKPRYPLPMYLYRQDHMQDVSYLLNLDIFYHYGLKDIVGTLRGTVQPLERRGKMWDDTFGRDAMLAAYERPDVVSEQTAFDDAAKAKVDANLENICNLIESHPETEFVFFMPPFSVLYWDRELRLGTFDATMDSVEYAMNELLPYENVRIYFYQGETDIITDLDNYKDYSHYGHWINDKLTEYIAQDKNRVTKDNAEAFVEQLREFVHAYNYEDIFAGNG